MARPIELDTKRARDKALLPLWQKGHEPTSWPDRLAATAIGRCSFHAACGDKRDLFEG